MEERLHGDARTNRVISEDSFKEIAKSFGVTEGIDTLLYFLNTTGSIFWDRNLFPGKIIIDQAWALDAIYSLFERQKCVHKLQSARGRFTLNDLGAWLWNELGHSPNEQQLFLGFMLSCRICFTYIEEGGSVTYIAPDSLPPHEAVKDALDLFWDEKWTTRKAQFKYDLLHDGLLRSLMYEIGRTGGMSVTYWRTGLQLYDKQSDSRLRISVSKFEGWSGVVTAEVQSNPTSSAAEPEKLIGRIVDLIGRMNEMNGLRTSTPTPQFLLQKGKIQSDGSHAVAIPATDPDATRGYFISYAWGDDTAEGLERAKAVDEFCAEAERRGISVNIDREKIRLGNSISAYMDRLSQGDKIFLFLSEKYLNSINCMTELTNAWKYSGRDPEKFFEHVKIYILPGTHIFNPHDRAAIKKKWHDNWLALKTTYESFDPTIMAKIGSPERAEIDMLAEIFAGSADILASISDRLHAPNFDKFCESWLGELEG